MNTNLNIRGHTKITAMVLSLLCWMGFMFLLFLASFLVIPLFPQRWERFLYGIAGSMGALFIVWLLVKNEKRSFADFGLVWQAGTMWRFVKGLLIGVAIFVLMITALVNFTELRFEKNTQPFHTAALFWYLAIIPLAFMEEVAFRSYSFLKLNKAFGLLTTQFMVAIAFAMYHVIGGQSVASAMLGPGAWAFIFGLAAVSSGGIAFPLGIHVALNVLQPLTGMKPGSYQPIWTIKFNGSVTGSVVNSGDAGLVIQLLLFVCGIICTIIYLRRRGKNK